MPVTFDDLTEAPKVEAKGPEKVVSFDDLLEEAPALAKGSRLGRAVKGATGVDLDQLGETAKADIAAGVDMAASLPSLATYVAGFGPVAAVEGVRGALGRVKPGEAPSPFTRAKQQMERLTQPISGTPLQDSLRTQREQSGLNRSAELVEKGVQKVVEGGEKVGIAPEITEWAVDAISLTVGPKVVNAAMRPLNKALTKPRAADLATERMRREDLGYGKDRSVEDVLAEYRKEAPAVKPFTGKEVQEELPFTTGPEELVRRRGEGSPQKDLFNEVEKDVSGTPTAQLLDVENPDTTSIRNRAETPGGQQGVDFFKPKDQTELSLEASQEAVSRGKGDTLVVDKSSQAINLGAVKDYWREQLWTNRIDYDTAPADVRGQIDRALSPRDRNLVAVEGVLGQHKAGKLNEAQTIQQLQQFATREGVPAEVQKVIEKMAQDIPNGLPKATREGLVGLRKVLRAKHAVNVEFTPTRVEGIRDYQGRGSERTTAAEELLDTTHGGKPVELSGIVRDKAGKQIGHVELVKHDNGGYEVRDINLTKEAQGKGIGSALKRGLHKAGFELTDSAYTTEAGRRMNSRLGGVGKRQGGAVGVEPPMKVRDQIETLEKKIEEMLATAKAGDEQLKLLQNTPLAKNPFAKFQRGQANFGTSEAIVDAARAAVKAGKNIFAEGKEIYAKYGEEVARAFLTAAEEARKNPDSEGKTSNALDRALGMLSTRARNLDPEFGQRFIRHEKDVSVERGEALHKTAEMFKHIGYLGKAGKAELNKALLNENFERVAALVQDSPRAQRAWRNTRETLDGIGKRLEEAELIEGRRDHYFPRRVKDYAGMLKEMGREKASALQKALYEAEARALAKGTAWDGDAATEVVNKFLRGPAERAGGAGFLKGRKFNEIPEELQKFYYSPSESLNLYIRQAVEKLNSAKFFGDALVREGARINLPDSIGAYVKRLNDTGRLSENQLKEAHQIIEARFGSHGEAGFWNQTYRDATHALTLGDIANTAVQLGDITPSIVMNGVGPTLVGVVGALTPKRFLPARFTTTKDLGLNEHIAEDFTGDRLTSRAVRRLFKANALARVDTLMKDINTISTRVAREAEAKSPQKGRLGRKYADRFGSRFPELVSDLRAGRRTPLTDELIFSELSQFQPISKMESPEFVARNQRVMGIEGRSVYVLKSFLNKQADFLRNNVYEDAKQGHWKAALKNAATFSVAAASSNMALQNLKDFWQNKPLTYEGTPDEIPYAMLKIFNLDRYFSDDLKQGNWGKAAAELVAPPTTFLDPVGKDIMQAAKNADLVEGKKKPVQGESVKLIPVVGDELYGRLTVGGLERRKRLEREKARKEARDGR